MNILLTGGCGFIGSNLVRYLRPVRPDWRVVNLDALTYAGNLESLADLADDPRHVFVRGDITDRALVDRLLQTYEVDAILHLAAESHVDRSILGPDPFIQTNVLGSQVLLEAARTHGVRRFVMVSTDEVYGSLPDVEGDGARGGANTSDGSGQSGVRGTGAQDRFTESSPLRPSSPYSASKASADLLALAYHRTFGLDVVVTRCGNNHGPYQFPEKLIPLMVVNALRDAPLPVYGDGGNVRDWLHVEDHCAALLAALERGTPGAIYNVGADAERRNLDVVHRILALLGKPDSLIRFVEDRPGHDRRYAVDASRAREELGWAPARSFEGGLEETVRWYVDNRTWWERVMSGAYREFYEAQYGARLAEVPGGIDEDF